MSEKRRKRLDQDKKTDLVEFEVESGRGLRVVQNERVDFHFVHQTGVLVRNLEEIVVDIFTERKQKLDK
jgi:hypothetical protein